MTDELHRNFTDWAANIYQDTRQRKLEGDLEGLRETALELQGFSMWIDATLQWINTVNTNKVRHRQNV